MNRITRRQFTGTSLATLGAAGLLESACAEEERSLLPTVRWGDHEITRMLVGHNPIKGVSHLTPSLSREMREWFAADPSRGVQMFRRCEMAGVNACQIGFRGNETIIPEILRKHYAEGGRLKWIASFYSSPQDREQCKQELAEILKMEPRPIGIQQLGNTSDRLMQEGKIDLALDNLKMFRDAGLLVGLGSHNHEVIDYVESKGWDLDFYQCCFYRSVFSFDPAKHGKETFEEEARRSMTHTIRQVSKPCIAFKVLGAGRHCGTSQTVEAALRYALQQIKPSDVILLGMWQKHKDQVAENARLVRKILGG
ncbi:MAG TPA: hypothetical protein VE890_14120 [Thermoguttaceae bacterium]|nr:hypothetical protein [Thermoguttaceae bacterium]